MSQIVQMPAPSDCDPSQLLPERDLQLPPTPLFLDRSKLKDVFGQDKTTWLDGVQPGIRARPGHWPGAPTNDQQNGVVYEKSLLRVHGISNGKAFMLSASADDMLTSGGEIVTIAFFHVHHCEAYNLYRSVGATDHTDFIWAAPSHNAKVLTSAYFHDLFVHNTGGSTSIVLLEAGRGPSFPTDGWNTVVVQNVVALNVSNNAYVKSNGKLLVIDSCSGFNWQLQGCHWDVVVLKRSPGVKVTLALGATVGKFIQDDNYLTPQFDARGNVIVPAAATPTAPTPSQPVPTPAPVPASPSHAATVPATAAPAPTASAPPAAPSAPLPAPSAPTPSAGSAVAATPPAPAIPPVVTPPPRTIVSIALQAHVTYSDGTIADLPIQGGQTITLAG